MAYAVRTNNINEIRCAYRKARRLHPGADHIVAAFNFSGTDGFQDDREHGAGSKLLRVLKDSDITNTAVFMVRVFRGTLLGQVRYDDEVCCKGGHIQAEATTELITVT